MPSKRERQLAAQPQLAEQIGRWPMMRTILVSALTMPLFIAVTTAEAQSTSTASTPKKTFCCSPSHRRPVDSTESPEARSKRIKERARATPPQTAAQKAHADSALKRFLVRMDTIVAAQKKKEDAEAK